MTKKLLFMSLVLFMASLSNAINTEAGGEGWDFLLMSGGGSPDMKDCKMWKNNSTVVLKEDGIPVGGLCQFIQSAKIFEQTYDYCVLGGMTLRNPQNYDSTCLFVANKSKKNEVENYVFTAKGNADCYFICKLKTSRTVK